jgi:hypothetical protein
MSNIYGLPQVPLVDAKGNMSAQWQGYFTALNRALNALGGIPPTPTSPSVLAEAYKGNWSSTTTYFPGDEVSSGGNVYRALLESLNVTPVNGTYWLLIGPLTMDWIANGGTYAKVLATGLTSGVVNTAGLTANAATALAITSDDNTYSVKYNSAVLSSVYSYASAIPYISSPVLTFTAPQNATIISTLTTNTYISNPGATTQVASSYVLMELLDTTAGTLVDYSPQSGPAHGYDNVNFGALAAGTVTPTTQLTFQMEDNVIAGHVYKLYLLAQVNGLATNLSQYFTSTQMQFENVQR